MDITQLVIIIISFILTFLVVLLSIQVWHILKEIRLSLQKMNKMLDDMSKVTGTVGESFAGMSGLINGLKAGLSVFSSLRKKESEDE